ncbi:PREDICTED: histamine N-methyltransferase-like [Branchiostoma belcheri]|uniref:Histamine N-methyltransferase-like n=1 Tax=Branchiostoma belcheri TaxID=7741 RepID=A0A6P4Z1H4_BRABE|nr:PREDICTED: histamine N-methyltransferase-like [Branchiostoma belcheri]
MCTPFNCIRAHVTPDGDLLARFRVPLLEAMDNFGALLTYSMPRYLSSFRAFLDSFDVSGHGDLSYGAMVPDSILCESGEDVRVLRIGSGSGEIDSVMLKKLLQRHSSVYIRVVEPSEEMIGRYKSLVREDTGLGAVKFDWRQQTADEYFTTKEETKFHLIHAVHVLYYVKDLHATLRNMWEELADGGYMLIAMESDRSDWGKMVYRLREIFGLGGSSSALFSSPTEIKQWFDEMKIGYVTSEDEVNMNVTACFKEESEPGKLLLDFLVHTPHVSSETDLRAAALEYILQNSSMVEDKIVLKSVNEVMVAFKTCE